MLEPNTPFVDGWALQTICQHLEAVSYGEINRLLITVPPGFMKSLLTDVFWPAWEWSALGRPHLRYVAFSYSAGLTERDNGKFRDLLLSRSFQELWGHVFKLRKIGETKVTNDKTGSKLATSVGGIGTGERGDRIICDDAHNVKEGESERIREETVRWFRESIQNRLNDMEKSAIIVIMQRVHESDVAGVIISEMDYTILMIPMEYEPGFTTGTPIWDDPREDEKQLAWPERFPFKVVERLKTDIGPIAYASQYQQTPVPRGGDIIKREYWQLWPDETPFPDFEFVLASADTAYTEKEENDPTGFTVWGIFKDKSDQPKAMLIWAWAKRLELHGAKVERNVGETEKEYEKRSSKTWGLVEWLAYSCRRFHVDLLLIEAKASGITVAQEMQRLHGYEKWMTKTVTPVGDKVSRAHSVEPIFAQGIVFAPDQQYAENVIAQCLIAGTRIITRLGVKKIEDICIGDWVLTHKGRFRPVLAIGNREADTTMTIAPKSLDAITLTPEHPFFALDITCERKVADLSWVKAEDLKNRDYRRVARYGNVILEAAPSRCHAATLPITQPENPIHELDLRDWIRLPQGTSMALFEDNKFISSTHWKSQVMQWRQPLDHKFGRFVGLYLAEGSANRYQTQWSFNAKERNFIDEIKDFALNRLGCSVRESTQKNCTIVSMSSPLLEDFFTDCGKGAQNKRIPSWAWDAPIDFIRGLVEGYIDGDGHDNEKTYFATSVSLSLIWGMRLLALRLGINATSRVLRKAGETTFPDGRTCKTLETYVMSWKKVPKNDGATTIYEDVAGYSVMDKSTSSEKVTVYNMHVFEDESYCTTGGLVHNCEVFPKGKNDDLTDSSTQALQYLRLQGLIAHSHEVAAELAEQTRFKPQQKPLYEV